MNIAKLGFLALGLLGLAAPANAHLVRIELQGHIRSVDATLASGFAAGQSATAWWIYETATPGNASNPGGVLDPTASYYLNAVTGGGARLGSYSLTFSPASRLWVENDNAYGRDRFMIDDHEPIGASVGGLAPDAIGIQFDNFTNLPFDDTALPEGPEDFTLFSGALMTFDFGNYLVRLDRVEVEFTSFTVERVPEPTAIGLLGTGVFGASAARALRRKRGKAVAGG